jgi:hypothetical protein
MSRGNAGPGLVLIDKTNVPILKNQSRSMPDIKAALGVQRGLSFATGVRHWER